METGTKYQGSYRIIGPPGTGKTTWLKRQVLAIADHNSVLRRGTRVLLCSLTKTAAKEMAAIKAGEDELPISKSSIGTLHAHCYRALEKPEIAETKVSEFNSAHPEFAIGAEGKSVDPDEPAWEAVFRSRGDKLYSNYTLQRSRMADRRFWPSETVAFATRWEQWKQDAKVMDFTDLVETCFREMSHGPGNPQQMIADEGQDLSALEYALFKKWAATADADFIAGDPYQALYVWRGAHPELFFDPQIEPEKVKVLRQSMRIPSAIHAVAQQWIERLSTYRTVNYDPREDVGFVKRSDGTWRQPERVVARAVSDFEKGRTVMIMGSCSFQMIPTIQHLRKLGIPFSNPWRPSRGDWNPIPRREGSAASRLHKFLSVDPLTCNPPRFWTLKEFGLWSALLNSKGVFIRGAKTLIKAEIASSPEDRVTVHDLRRWFHPAAASELESLSFRDDPASTEALLSWIESNVIRSKIKSLAFPITIARTRGPARLIPPGQSDPAIFVGTIHSFKGGEADCSYVFPDLSSAGSMEWLSGGSQRDNVIRTFYVALTRAKLKLVICAPTERGHVTIEV